MIRSYSSFYSIELGITYALAFKFCNSSEHAVAINVKFFECALILGLYYAFKKTARFWQEPLPW